MQNFCLMVRSLCFAFVMPSTSAYTLLDHEIRDCQCVESFPVQFSCQFCGNRARATVTMKRHLPSMMRQTPLRADILRVVNDIKSHCYVPRQPRNNLFPQAHHSHFVGVAVLTPSTWQTSWVPSIQEVKHSNLCGGLHTHSCLRHREGSTEPSYLLAPRRETISPRQDSEACTHTFLFWHCDYPEFLHESLSRVFFQPTCWGVSPLQTNPILVFDDALL